jgi:hypothetical protein
MILTTERLRQRETERYGERIMAGGDMYEQSQAFLDWASSYDDGDLNMRSRQRHKQSLSTLPCPPVCIEGDDTIGSNSMCRWRRYSPSQLDGSYPVMLASSSIWSNLSQSRYHSSKSGSFTRTGK